MLQRLDMEMFTVFFAAAKVRFVPGLNIIVGDNGYGKSHLLKLAYAACASRRAAGSEGSVDKHLASGMASKLINVFRPDHLGRLVARRRGGRDRAEVAVWFAGAGKNGPDLAFWFDTHAAESVTLKGKVRRTFPAGKPVFIPTKEVISTYPGFIALYQARELVVDETNYDLCLSLALPLTRGPRSDEAKKLLKPLEAVLGGTVTQADGRFHVKHKGLGNIEMPLLAEGFRKFATLAYLVANGELAKGSVLFWDEPESNLNAHHQKVAVKVLRELAMNGVQVVLATHSMFLLREFELAQRSIKVPTLYTGLGGEPGDVSVQQVESVEELEPLVMLDEEVRQARRAMEETP